MYVKRHAVVRGQKRYVYLRLVQAYRDEQGRVRHRVLRTLGREDELKASGQLEQLMGSFARLDPPLVGVRRDIGPLLLAAHFMTELDLIATIDRALPQRGRQQLSVGEVAAALIASRLCSPSPLYDVAGWASGAAIHELMGIPPALLNDDRLGRGLETLAVYAESLRGALAARAIERFGIDAGRLHVDLTTLRVAGAYEDSALVAKGWGADRRVARQVRVLQATTACGVSVYVRPDPGNAAEVALIGASLERLKNLTSPGLIIADAACGYPKTLCEIARSGLRFIVALRAQTGFRERYLTDVGPTALRALHYVAERQQSMPADQRTRYRGALRDWQITDPQTNKPVALRVAYIHSSQEAREVAAARERALTKAEDALARVQRGLGGRYYKTRRHVDNRVAKILTGPVEGLISVTTATRARRPTLTFARPRRDHQRRPHRRRLRPGDQPPRPTDRQSRARALQGPADRRAPPPRHQADTQSPPNLPAQRRPHLRPDEHRRHRAADLRPDRVPNPPSTRPRTAARPAARRPRRQAHRPQHPQRLPRPRPHLHPQRHPPGPPHPHPTTHPRPPQHPAALARTARPCPRQPRKMRLAGLSCCLANALSRTFWTASRSFVA